MTYTQLFFLKKKKVENDQPGLEQLWKGFYVTMAACTQVQKYRIGLNAVRIPRTRVIWECRLGQVCTKLDLKRGKTLESNRTFQTKVAV